MLGRSLAIICMTTLSASAQPPAPKTSAPLCEMIASAAFGANRGLHASNLTEGRKAPFVSSWLVQNALRSTSNDEFSSMGAVRNCKGPVTDRCYRSQSDEWDLPSWEAGEALPKKSPPAFASYGQWVSLIGLLPVGGEFLEVMGEPEHGPFNYSYPSGAFVKSIYDHESMVCAFDSRLHERYSASKPETEGSCAALMSDGSEVVEPDLDVPSNVTQGMFRADRPSTRNNFYDFYPVGMLKLDVDGDGKIEHLIKVRGMPSHGRCYGAIYYDVLDSKDSSKFSTEPVRQLVENAQSAKPACGYETRIRRVGGRIVFETAGMGLGAIEKQGVPVVVERAGLLERQLREISNSNVRHLCTTTFSVEPVVRYAR